MNVAPSYSLHLGDCLAYMRTLPDGRVDAVVTDPPYNVGLAYSDGDNRGDYPQWCAAWFAELERVSIGPIAISCGIGNLLMWQQIKVPDWVMAWHKPNSMKRVMVGWNTWEPVLLYRKTRGKKTHDSFRVSIAPQKDTGNHPCPKPLGWAIELVDRLTKPGVTVFDPFAGSGTTGVACIQTGRKFIGCEIDPTYFAIAQKRIAEAAQQPLLLETA